MGGNLSYLEAAATIPWAIWGVERSMCFSALENENVGNGVAWLKGIALCATAMTVLALSGDPQALYMTSIFLFACALVRPRKNISYRHALGRLGLAGIVSIFAASPQLLPAIFASSVRETGTMALSEARKYSLNPLRLLEFWSSGPWRTPDGDVPIELFSVQDTDSCWAASIFLGAVVLSLALVAIVQSKMRREIRLLAGLGTFALIVSLGAGTWVPVYEFLQHALPGWKFLRFPEKTVVFITFAAAMLAGLGAQCLFESFRSRKWLSLKLFQHRLFFFFMLNVLFLILIDSRQIDSLLIVMAGAPVEALSELEEIRSSMSVSLFSGALFALLAWILTLPAKQLSHRLNEALIGVAVIASLLGGTYGAMRINLGNPASLQKEPGAISILREHVDNLPMYGRLRLYTHYEPDEALKCLRQNSAISRGDLDFNRQAVLNLTLGVNGLFLLENAYGFIPLTVQGRGMTAIEKLPTQVYFRGFNVRAAQRLIENPTHPEKTFELLFDDRAGDRIRLVQGIPVGTMEEAIEVANRPHFDSVKVVPVETKDAVYPTEASKAGKVDVVTYSPEYIDVKSYSETATTLFVADAFADGWRAKIDGEEVPIYPGLIAGRAIPVPAGEHRVELTYKTPGLRVGLVLSAIGWLAIIALAIGSRWRRRQKPEGEAAVA